MTGEYKILYQGGTGEIVEKKSRFIATTKPVKSEEEALAFIEEMRKKYWDATHNCSAFVIGRDNKIQRCSDDGEPGQTAGKPMLDVLLGEGIHDACVVVTRYFGGTLLGTGGLVRAYSKAAQEGLLASRVVTKKPAKEIQITTDYNGVGKIQYIAGQMDIKALDSQYTEQVVFSFLVPLEMTESFISKVTEGTNGRSQIEEKSCVYYGISEKELILFPESLEI